MVAADRSNYGQPGGQPSVRDAGTYSTGVPRYGPWRDACSGVPAPLLAAYLQDIRRCPPGFYPHIGARHCTCPLPARSGHRPTPRSAAATPTAALPTDGWVQSGPAASGARLHLRRASNGERSRRRRVSSVEVAAVGGSYRDLGCLLFLHYRLVSTQGLGRILQWRGHRLRRPAVHAKYCFIREIAPPHGSAISVDAPQLIMQN